jgi:hypothetical protein
VERARQLRSSPVSIASTCGGYSRLPSCPRVFVLIELWRSDHDPLHLYCDDHPNLDMPIWPEYEHMYENRHRDGNGDRDKHSWNLRHLGASAHSPSKPFSGCFLMSMRAWLCAS